MFDEHQDCSPLTDAVSHRLASGPRCKRVVVCGDPQQSIMGFLGASPKCFETWDATTKTFLYHSHRVPEHVGRTAEESLTMQPGFGHCRDGITWRDSDSVDLDARFVYEITRRTLYGYLGTINWQKEREGTTLVLARTRRLAMTAQAAFRRRGIPAALIGQNFRTKWVRAHESWLRFERGEGVSWEAFRNMVATCRSQLVLDDGTRDIISFSNIDKVRRKRVIERDVVFLSDLPDYGFSELTMNLVKSGDHYLLLNTRYRDEFGNMTMLYPDQFERPRVQLGTIHSAKGMEADHVILLPEVGKRIQSRCASDPEFRAEECRLTYVAITRAKKTCTVPYRFARPRNLYGLNCLPLSFLKMPRW